jgi:chromosome segregation ATPase
MADKALEEKDIKTVRFIQRITTKAVLSIFGLIGVGIGGALTWGFAGASKAYQTEKDFTGHCTQQEKWKDEIKTDKTEMTGRIDRLFSDGKSMGIAVTKTSKSVDELNTKVDESRKYVADSLIAVKQDLDATANRTIYATVAVRDTNDKIRILEDTLAKTKRDLNSQLTFADPDARNVMSLNDKIILMNKENNGMRKEIEDLKMQLKKLLEK